jgi:anaerobic C4-dicarboxylate transporter DcuB
MSVSFVLEALVVLGAIVMGTRAGGVGVGLWGGLGTFVLVFVFGEPPGAPPAAAMAIILAVVTAAALMQAAGGIDWMVAMAAKVIESRPKQITLIAPLTAFVFSIGAGTGNIIYPLMPVIYDVSYRNHIRPSRPLTVTVVQSGIALAASPVSAAMAAMLTLTDVAPYNLGLTQILAITIPSCVIGIVVTSLVVNRMWKDLDDDPEVQAKIASGELLAPEVALATAGAAPAPAASGRTAVLAETSVPAGVSVPPEKVVPAAAGGAGASASSALTYTKAGRNSALVFFAGVIAIVILGLFPDLRPTFALDGGESATLDMTNTIVLVMFVVGVAILFVGKPDVKEVPDMSVFKAGMISAIALFGIAWLTATFISAHEEYIIDTVGAWVTNWTFLFALAVFMVAALTTSQSTATRTIVPIGLAAGLPPGIVTGMWAGALGGVYTLPANGTQIAAANFDLSGTTKLGTKLLDHSFFVPMLVLSVTTIAVGAAIGAIFF